MLSWLVILFVIMSLFINLTLDQWFLHCTRLFCFHWEQNHSHILDLFKIMYVPIIVWVIVPRRVLLSRLVKMFHAGLMTYGHKTIECWRYLVEGSTKGLVSHWYKWRCFYTKLLLFKESYVSSSFLILFKQFDRNFTAYIWGTI